MAFSRQYQSKYYTTLSKTLQLCAVTTSARRAYVPAFSADEKTDAVKNGDREQRCWDGARCFLSGLLYREAPAVLRQS